MRDNNLLNSFRERLVFFTVAASSMSRLENGKLGVQAFVVFCKLIWRQQKIYLIYVNKTQEWKCLI